MEKFATGIYWGAHIKLGNRLYKADCTAIFICNCNMNFGCKDCLFGQLANKFQTRCNSVTFQTRIAPCNSGSGVGLYIVILIYLEEHVNGETNFRWRWGTAQTPGQLPRHFTFGGRGALAAGSTFFLQSRIAHITL